MISRVIKTCLAAACLLAGAGGQALAQLGGGSGPISGYHDGPHGDGTSDPNCTNSGCHGGGSYSGSANFIIPATIPHGSTTSGQAFRFDVSTNAPAWGFNIAIYDSTDLPAGKITTGYSNLNAPINATPSNGELQHFNAQTGTTDPRFDWTAPSTLGTYYIYGCLNQVDNDGVGFDADDGPAVCDRDSFVVINNPPNAVNDSTATGTSVTVGEDSGLSALFDVLANDSQTESDTFSWFSTSTAGLTGSLTDNGDGTYRYDPNGQFESLAAGESTTTSFTYTIEENGYGATDCQGSPCRDTATVTLQIDGANDRPTAVNDGSVVSPFVTVQEGMAVDNGTDGNGSNDDLASNDTDPDASDNRDATRTGCPAGVTGPANGTITNFGADGTFTYTHDGSNTTADSFTYCTIDDSGTGTNRSLNSATVFIEITPVNDSPTISTSAGNTAFTEQTPVVVDADLTLADSDSTQFDGATVQITGNFQAGDSLACSLPLPGGITSCSFAGSTLTLTGTSNIADYESALEGVTFDSSSDNPDLGARTITFIVEDDLSAFSLPGATKQISPIVRSNDPPTIAAIPNQNAFEDTAADPYTFTYTAVASDVDVDDDINDGGASTGGTPTLFYSLSGLSGPLATMTISSNSPNHGLISWNPPQTGTFGQVYGPITVSIEDGNEDGSPANSVSFSITVSPPDDDGDLIANYDDVCLTVADGSNADNDGDGTPGSDGGVNDGGDVCDADDDNDGMPDSYETANGFDPFDAADAGQDADGDGISNLQEFLDGTDPNFANLVIDATGYLTPFELSEPDPTIIHPQATSASPSTSGPFRPGRNTITWTASNSGNSNLATADQTLDVRPLANFAASQLAVEGSAASVVINLNGSPPSYPVTLNYTVSGTASNPADHDAASGSVTFNAPSVSETIGVNIVNDAAPESNETIVFTLTSATNAALGSQRSHRITIVEHNVAPIASLRFSQPAGVRASVYVGDGAVTIDAPASDINPGQTLSYDWSGTDNALVPPVALNQTSWNPTIPGPGNYLIDVVVNDDGVPSRSTRVTRILNVVAGSAPALTGADSDGDGLADNDPAEGHEDDDGDGIPNYLDASSANSESNLVPDQTVTLASSYLLQTGAGLLLQRGRTAESSGAFGAKLTQAQIVQFGGPTGAAPTDPADDFRHVSGIYDFRISGLVPGSSASVVIPLTAGIPRNAVYRKFDPAIGWGDFALGGGDALASAPGALGACPEPGHNAYRSGLNYLDLCLQVTIRDGGPNDSDNQTNGIVADPGAVGVRLSDPEIEEVEEGSGRMTPLMLLLLTTLGLLGAWRRRQGGLAEAR